MRSRQEYYKTNEDYRGYVINNGREEGIFPDGSGIRIWYNDLPASYEPHWHNAVEIILPLENWYEVIISDTLESYHVVPGEFIIIPSGKIHELHAPETGNRFVFMFDSDLLSGISGYSSMRTLLGSCSYITPDRYMLIYPELHEHLTKMANEYFEGREFYEFSILSELYQFFVTLSRFQLASLDLFSDSKPAMRSHYFQLFNQVLEYINLHYMEKISLDDVAAICCLSKYHFSRRFKEYSGQTFYDYLTDRRITAAEELLSRQELSITEVAMQSGFSSISAFNRAFSLHKHCTPTEYCRFCDQQPKNQTPSA